MSRSQHCCARGSRSPCSGGWAEELHGLTAQRQHHDIDLLVIDADVVALDAYVRAHGEVVAKRQTHKRAFIGGDVLVELFLVSTDGGQPLTNFWGSLEFWWPSLGPVERQGLPVASIDAITVYRAHHDCIAQARWCGGRRRTCGVT